MADILIRGMEMPRDASLWLLIRPDGKVHKLKVGGKYGKPQQGVAVPLPEGHGRLIDAERFRVILCRLKERQSDDVAIHALNWAIECLDKLESVVDAEGEGD